ncbi:hypothetical protein KIH79_12260 [Bifidobacterium sp. 82T10]|uniref:DUF5648 domain-containing protein n=1 Tax=Bifidobacterium miconis TaxID=2834435 RepID=A0ABS6WHZ6_9BIFI|nr:hypothetical protein [Bifidobacterium miconis]MBW3093674.1 hypothetical protein [Bifidobacterium miconis]
MKQVGKTLIALVASAGMVFGMAAGTQTAMASAGPNTGSVFTLHVTPSSVSDKTAGQLEYSYERNLKFILNEITVPQIKVEKAYLNMSFVNSDGWSCLSNKDNNYWTDWYDFQNKNCPKEYTKAPDGTDLRSDAYDPNNLPTPTAEFRVPIATDGNKAPYAVGATPVPESIRSIIVKKSADPTLTGIDFVLWQQAESSNKGWGGNTVTAVWTSNVVRVSFDRTATPNQPSTPNTPNTPDTPSTPEPDEPSEPTTGTVSVYRLYDPKTHLHLYTTDPNERTVLSTKRGWQDEGIVFHASGNTTGATPVYRLYNPKTNRHLITLDGNERTTLTTRRGWKDEGIAWYQAKDGSVPVYRMYSPKLSEHLYTTDVHEYQINSTRGWNPEGVAWQGQAE